MCGNCGRPRHDGRGACGCIPAWVWQDPEMIGAVRERDAQAVVCFLRRRVRSLSQEALARMCGVAQSTITRAEAGRGLTDRRKAMEALRGLGAPLDSVSSEKLGYLPSHAPFEPAGPMLNLDEIASALAPHAVPSTTTAPFSLAELAEETRQAKADYQACRYAAAARRIPRLLNALEKSSSDHESAIHQRLYHVKTDAYHVTASVLLKCDERGLAWLAADRSYRAAQTAGDPVLIGSSARVYVRALMRERRYRTAADLATAAAQRVQRDTDTPTPASLSVYGALLLSGAVAAAKREDRDAALSLLTEAQEVARRLGGDHNHRWTAFGPTNVLLHRVSTAVELGDAGQAVEQARSIHPEHLPLTERRVVLHVDTARALAQWGKLREAYAELTEAENLAPEELKERPRVHALIEELRTRSSGHLRRGLTQLADRVGALR